MLRVKETIILKYKINQRKGNKTTTHETKNPIEHQNLLLRTQANHGDRNSLVFNNSPKHYSRATKHSRQKLYTILLHEPSK